MDVEIHWSKNIILSLFVGFFVIMMTSLLIEHYGFHLYYPYKIPSGFFIRAFLNGFIPVFFLTLMMDVVEDKTKEKGD